MMSLKTQWWRRFTNKEVTTNKGERFREKGVRVGGGAAGGGGRPATPSLGLLWVS